MASDNEGTSPDQSRIQVRPMRDDDAGAVAKYHVEGISGGFLTSLGVKFLKDLYQCVHASKEGFVLVAVNENDAVQGFVAGVTRLKKVYRSVLIRRGWLYMFLLARHLLSISTLKRMFQTVSYMGKRQEELPDAELLSIVVAIQRRGSGVARALFVGLVDEFRRRGVIEFKILVGAHLESANAFYRKQGCQLVCTVKSHGLPSNIYIYRVFE